MQRLFSWNELFPLGLSRGHRTFVTIMVMGIRPGSGSVYLSGSMHSLCGGSRAGKQLCSAGRARRYGHLWPNRPQPPPLPHRPRRSLPRRSRRPMPRRPRPPTAGSPRRPSASAPPPPPAACVVARVAERRPPQKVRHSGARTPPTQWCRATPPTCSPPTRQRTPLFNHWLPRR